ncbi:hypothetical protein [Burkholderia latens]|nr:hypothetical protein [Burkholderia latens]
MNSIPTFGIGAGEMPSMPFIRAAAIWRVILRIRQRRDARR